MEQKGPKVEDYISQNTDVFTGDGKLRGLLHLEIDTNAQPVQLPTRKVLIALREPLKQAGQMIKYWSVSEGRYTYELDLTTSGLVTTKTNGKVRLCIDPKPLNKALHRNQYPLPTIDDVVPVLSKAHVFTVLDAKNWFWHIQLDESSSFATSVGKLYRCTPSSRGVSEED